MARRPGAGRDRIPDVVTASEIAAFVYCPEQWRLEHGLGLPPENQAALRAGRRHHARKTLAERLAGRSIALGRTLVILACLLLLLLLLALIW
jgi:hypothetical protein